MSELACPAKVYDDYTCQVTGADGKDHYYDDLLFEGQLVSIRGNHSEDPPYGRVVRKEDGLWIEALTDEEERGRSFASLKGDS
jgi:hypothetical protein